MRMRLTLAIVMVLSLLLAGCPKPLFNMATGAGDRLSAASSLTTLHGRVEPRFFTTGRQTQSSLTEIANAATVSLMDSVTGVTQGSSKTLSDGTFVLTFGSGFRPDPTKFYILEAVKGLSGGALPNRAGVSAARVRTLLQWVNGTGWTSLTQGGITISMSTTAVCIITSLRQFVNNPATMSPLINSVVIAGGGGADTFTPGSSGIQMTEYNQVLPLVSEAISFDEDPVGQIIFNTETGNYSKQTNSIGLTGVNPNYGRIGDYIVLNGSNFISDLTQIKVQFNGVRATNVVRNTLGSQLTVQIPPGATSGPLGVQIGTVVFGGLNFRILSWDGHTPFDSQGNMYVAGYANNCLYRIAPDGTLSLWVSSGLNGPRGLVVGPDDSVYVANWGNNTISKITSGAVVSTYATGGGLNQPWGLALDRNGNLYVANNNGVLKVTPGNSTPAVYSTNAAIGRAAGLAFDASENLYVSSNNNNDVLLVATSSLAVTTPVTGLSNPGGLAMDSTGNLFIADYGNNAVERYDTSGTLTTYQAAVGTHAGPYAVAFDPTGNLYVGNWDSHTLYMVSPSGAIKDMLLAPRTPWGIVQDPTTNDLYITVRNSLRRWQGRPRDTRVYRVKYNNGNYGPFEVALDGFSEPSAAGFDSNHQMYVADYGTNRIYTANPTTGARQIWVSGVSVPTQMAFDSSNNMYLARWQNPPCKITTGGIVSYFNSGQNLTGGVYDGSGNLYVTEESSGYLLKITPTGVTTVIATGLSKPEGIVLVGSTLYVTEANANRIGTFSLAGVRGSDLSSGSPLNQPMGIAYDGSNFLVSNWGDANVVKVPGAGGVGAVWATAGNPLRKLVLTGGNLYGTNWAGQTITQINQTTPSSVNNAFTTLPTVGGMGVTINPWGIATDNTNLYVTMGNNENSRVNAGWSGVYSIPLATPSTVTQIDAENTWLSGLILNPSGGLTAINYNKRGLNNACARTMTTTGSSGANFGSYLYASTGVAYDGTNILETPFYNTLMTAVNKISPVDGSWSRFFNHSQAIETTLYVDRSNGDVYVCSLNNSVVRYNSSGVSQTTYSGIGDATGIVKEPNGDLIGVSPNNAVQGVPLYMIPTAGTAAQVMTNWPYRPGF